MLLFYDQAYLDTVLKSLTGFARDRKHAEETSDINAGAAYRLFPPQNSPTIVNKTTLLICRRLLGQQSKTMSFEGPLFLPMFATDRLFPSTGNLELKLFFNSSDFVLMGSSTEAFPPCKLQIERLELKLKRIQLSETAHGNVNSILQRERRLLYPILDYEMQNFVFYKDTTFRTTPETILPGTPRRIFVMFVRSDNFAGYNFHANCQYQL